MRSSPTRRTLDAPYAVKPERIFYRIRLKNESPKSKMEAFRKNLSNNTGKKRKVCQLRLLEFYQLH
jgi:hypothetical protein